MTVRGIGGIFFRAADPDALASWYRTHLNVGAGCVADPAATPDRWSWLADGGPVAFAPLATDSDYFPADRQWMLNLRVDGLDALVGDVARRRHQGRDPRRMGPAGRRTLRPAARSGRQSDRVVAARRLATDRSAS